MTKMSLKNTVFKILTNSATFLLNDHIYVIYNICKIIKNHI